MKYTHVRTDHVGAEEKYYKVAFNNPEELKDVIIHLGYFNLFMPFW